MPGVGTFVMRFKVGTIVILVGGFLVALPLVAHHSLVLSDRYELNETVSLVGVISGVQWTNPHIGLEIEVTDAEGETRNWFVDLPAAGWMEREGLERTDIPPGDEVHVDAWIAKDGSPSATAQSLRLSDGRTFTDDSPTWRVGARPLLEAQ